MADTSADEFSHFPVESIARFLTVCGSEDPDLLRRSRLVALAPVPGEQSRTPREAVEHEKTPQHEYLEELVSIAVASARQAEDAVRQVHATGASARRRMVALAAFGVAGIFVGLAGMGSQYVHWAQPQGVSGGEHSQSVSSVSVSDARIRAHAVAVTGTAPAPIPAAAPRVPTPPATVDVRVAEVFPAAPRTEAAVADLPSVEALLREEPPAPGIAPVAVEAAPIQAAENPAIATPAEQVADSTYAMEATLHATAGAGAPPPAATPREPAAVAVASAAPEERAAPIFVPQRPLPPNARAVEIPSREAAHAEHPASAAPVTRVHSAGAVRTTPSQLVAAVQALESLTDELPAARGEHAPGPWLNNRM